MPGPAVNGIIITLSIIAALSVAVLENPQIQAWLEQQRQKIAELLRSIGEELDPQSRRRAEAFAFEGRTPANDEGLRREVSGSQEAAAIATGRSLSCGTIRHIPVRGPSDPGEAEERRRKGREYLAQRNQQMYELKQRKASGEGTTTPPTPTSFDAIVDDDGKLRMVDNDKELPSPPVSLPSDLDAEMREIEPRPLEVAESSSSGLGNAGWSFGALVANPFGDEYAMDRSETPKPPIPPKVALDTPEHFASPPVPGSFTPRQASPPPQIGHDDLSYEEQLAIALSLSEAEAASSARSSLDETDDDDAALRAAIVASLKDMPKRKTASRSGGPGKSSLAKSAEQPLVDLSPPSPTVQPRMPAPRRQWETLFDQNYSPTEEPMSLLPAAAPKAENESDELYRLTPELTRARLASLDGQQAQSMMPQDAPRVDSSRQTPAALDASFYSAASAAPSPASTRTMEPESTPQLIDIDEDAPADGARTPTSRASFGFQTDTESDSDTFASLSEAASRAQSRARSEISNVEVIDVEEDSDVDMLSQEGDGIKTPDSWSEVGSQDGDSEVEDTRHSRRIPIS